MAALLNLVREYCDTVGTGPLHLTGAVASFRSFTAANAVDGGGYNYALIDVGVTPNAREVGYGVYNASARTLTRIFEDSTTGSPLYLSGNTQVFCTLSKLTLPTNVLIVPEGRLTLTSTTPIMLSNVSGATAVHYVPYVGSLTCAWNDDDFVIRRSDTAVSQNLTDTTYSPAAAVADAVYDMFVWWDVDRLRLSRGPAWVSGTARGTGAGTTELNRLHGTLVNENAITNGPAKWRGTYVGTIRTNASATVDFIRGDYATGGVKAFLGVWNMYNRVDTYAFNYDTTTSWTYATAAWRTRNNAANARITFVSGMPDDCVDVSMQQTVEFTSSSTPFYIAPRLDGTSLLDSAMIKNSSGSLHARSMLETVLGVHYIEAMEYGAANTVCTPGRLALKFRM
jgi:hypothetical protein